MSRESDLYAHFDVLVAALRRFGCDGGDAREIAHDTIAKTWANIANVAPGAEKVYMIVAAQNEARKRGKRARPEVPIDDEHPSKGGSPEQEAIAKQERTAFLARFRAAMEELPEETRLCVALRLRDVSYKDIAARLDCRLTAVQSRLHRAYEHFRTRLGSRPDDLRSLELLGDHDDQQG